ncbi:MAG: GtrA family protein [Desulfovibrio sp.]|jgi:putative flippase GtrA|nr:GtrA family protein [Desulfovibrio sp.]
MTEYSRGLQSLVPFVRSLFARRWIRFGFVGGVSAFNYFLFGYLLVTVLALPIFLGNAAAYLLAFGISYTGQCRWTFQAQGFHKSMLPRYALAQAAGLVLNTCLIWLLRHIGLSYILSMPVAALLVAFVTYLLCKYFVFRSAAGK